VQCGKRAAAAQRVTERRTSGPSRSRAPAAAARRPGSARAPRSDAPPTLETEVESDDVEGTEPEILEPEDDDLVAAGLEPDGSAGAFDDPAAFDDASDEDTDDPEATSDRRMPPASRSSLVPLSPSSGAIQDALAQYFQEIGRYPLLSREEEHDLAVRVHDEGDRDAAQRLVLSNLRLVVKIAMEYRRVWTNLLDLIQEGNVGLLQSVKRYDPHRGVKLSSYGAYWIRAYILKYLIDNIRTVRMGSSRAERKIFYSLSRARRELEREGFSPTPALLAERLDVQPEDVESVQRRLAHSDVSLDAPLTAESGAPTLGDRQTAPGQSMDDAVSERDMQVTFRQHIERFGQDLDEREAVILRDRMMAEEPRTLQEIGDQFGLTRERVRQIEKKLVDRLRAYMKENLVDFDYWAPSES
jgi:RNA polymerase sigma-32 factor